MLEFEGRLLTWNLDALPDPWAEAIGEPPGGGSSVAAAAIADHRLAYLEYEGPISGGRGTVRRIDAGTCVMMHFAADHYKGAITGDRLRGTILLERIEAAVWRLAAARAGSGRS